MANNTVNNVINEYDIFKDTIFTDYKFLNTLTIYSQDVIVNGLHKIIVENENRDSEYLYLEIRNFLVQKYEGLTFLIEAAKKFHNYVKVRRDYGFNPYDMIRDIINIRIKAFERVALYFSYDLDDEPRLLEDFERIARYTKFT